MSNILVINASGQETRVALIENGIISEYYLERKNEKGILGNIYKGRVVRVLPGMQAAFVDIGLEKAAFLYVADIVSDPSFPGFTDEIEIQASAVEGDPLEVEDLAEPSESAEASASAEGAPEDGRSAQPAASSTEERAAAPMAAESAPAIAPASEHATGSAGAAASIEPPADVPAAASAPASPSAASTASASLPATPAADATSSAAAAPSAQPASSQDATARATSAASASSAAGANAGATSPAGSTAAHAAPSASPADLSAPVVETARALEAPASSAAAPATGSETSSTPAITPTGDEPILELSPEEALEEGEEGDDDEPEDEGDAAHALAEEQLAEEAAKAADGDEDGEADGDGEGAEPAAAAGAPAAADGAPGEGKIGLPADRAAARERRGRRRGGRGRRRPEGGNGKTPEKAAAPAEQQAPREQRPRSDKPEQRRSDKPEQNGQRRSGGNGGGGNGQSRQKAQIQDLLKEGDEVLVQVVKDPIGTKGARITCHISLPGRHLVFMPTVDHVGISRRIENEKERRRLRELVDQYRPPGTGFIVRTVAENEPREKLVADIKFLLGLWNEVGKKKDQLKAPALLHPDLDLILRSIRDLFSDEVDKVVIDDRAEYERVKAFVDQVAPELAHGIEQFQGDEPIFDEYGVEQELLKAQNRKVWLKSGGYIIIDQTEALVAIDVNSGRYTGKKSLEETITKINCEAAKEIVYQLRLRNIGGIIIIDFIDMDKGQNRDKVFKTLQEALAADRAKTNVLKISDIGLVEMTRKRVRESVGRLTTESCPTCDGRGHIRSKHTVVYEIMRECQRAAKKHREDQLVVSCHPDVAKFLQGTERDAMRLLMMKLNKSIVVRPQPQYHAEQYDLHGKWSRPELQSERGRPPVLGRPQGRGGRDGRRDGQQAGREGQQGGRDTEKRDTEKREPPPGAPAAAEQKPEGPAEKVNP
jgi:ribonuclease E